MDEFEMKLLSLLKGEYSSLTIEFNQFASNYETAEQADTWGSYWHPDEWISAEDKQKAIASNRVWCIHWYPDTPVGFCRIFGSSLQVVCEAALGEGKE